MSECEFHKTSLSCDDRPEFNSEFEAENKVRCIELIVTGIVQSVGFRPYVHLLAVRHGLRGQVKNEFGRVKIEVEGKSAALEDFMNRIRTEPPPLASIVGIEAMDRPLRGYVDFRIDRSEGGGPTCDVFVSPDVAVCEDCLREMRDPGDRRFRYPFLNCVNCGPRFTIIESVPYDRGRTTMKGFELCSDCRSEYESPTDRRYHAQPVACPKCGPTLVLRDRTGKRSGVSDPIEAVAKLLRESSGIVAIKSLGGYHLACNALIPSAVSEIRNRKGRDGKPLAIMVENVIAAKRYCSVSDREARVLSSRERPIVLLSKRRADERGSENTGEIAPEVSLGSPELGVMLPYTPLHHMLLRAVDGVPLVMTSANLSDRPIIYNDEFGPEGLSAVADWILNHDRPIRSRCDDSVVRIDALSEERSGPAEPLVIRRGRGYAPSPLLLPESIESKEPILAVGGQLKNTFAFSSGRHLVVSHHIGDLDELEVFQDYCSEISRFEALFETRPAVLVHDLHPDYSSTRYARERAEAEGATLIGVQHHHAHMASCMVEHELDEAVIGVTFDGTGMGTDGRIWGGEFLIGGYRSFERAAHLRYVPMPGGEQAVREPWRMAVSHLIRANIDPVSSGMEFPSGGLKILERMMDRNLNCPLTSSAGRLFDAVAALNGFSNRIAYEGQAAIELEWLAATASREAYRNEEEIHDFDLIFPGKSENGEKKSLPIEIDSSPVIRKIVEEAARGEPGPEIARRFHLSMARMIERVSTEIRKDRGIDKVVLSGGVFMNRILLADSVARLRESGFRVFYNRRLPANDGGLSAGQLAIAVATLHGRGDRRPRTAEP